jgi:formimidoylglutamate deiminase
MASVFARRALLDGGWAEDVRLEVSDGRIDTVATGVAAEEQELAVGIVIPGLGNAHSHAFQRALAGHTEHREGAEKDTFWTWRNRMYRLAGQVDAVRLTAIARQLYTEMLASGYTAVAEFHYLHTEPDAVASDAMFDAIATAADETGIRLTYVPVLYEHSGFDGSGPNDDQRRFAQTPDSFLAHYSRARERVGDRLSVAIGAHSLRAVAKESLAEIVAVAEADDCPMHIHVAEQLQEVEQCLEAWGARPVEWLLDNFELSNRWCLVHATHMIEKEITRLAASGAVVCVCPSTEANLGDGLFALRRWLQQQGNMAIGSDSHISINPFEELRWLEYGQRLKSQSRNVAAVNHRHTGRSLFEKAASGGALACGTNNGTLKKGAAADLLVLDDDSPMLSGHSAESILDALVFSGFTLPIDRVMVAGEWQVVDGRHCNRAYARSEYNRVVKDLLPAISST